MAEPAPNPEVEPTPDPERDELLRRRDRALDFVRKFGDPVLRNEAREVDQFDPQLAAQVETMVAIMQDSMGIGLAAPQIGSPRRVVVYQVGMEEIPVALINPQIEWSSALSEPHEEGCLSLPGVLIDVDRPVHVRVSALRTDGEPQIIEASGLEARVIQHEIDHLDGVLILDRASKEQRRAALRTMRDAEEQSGYAA